MAHKKHEKIIKEWLAGAKIEYKNSYGDWSDPEDDQPGFFKDIEYRIKPEAPERPVTKMTNEEIQRLLVQNRGLCESVVMARIVADASLRHACDNGQIVTREEFDRAITDRKARDMAVAEAARRSFSDLTNGCWDTREVADAAVSIYHRIQAANLEAIIAEVG